ncbi:MAG: large subunit ribosomal protein [Chloroflexota bacterium]|jgi:large subunit ribosomal protein L30|nr:large subunit ribosomal protein [Chloroflexota bacterium]
MAAKLRVTLIKSPISHTQRTRATMSALGLHRIGQSVVVDDTPELRGMTRAIRFLLRTEPADGTENAAAKATGQSAARKKEASES